MKKYFLAPSATVVGYAPLVARFRRAAQKQGACHEPAPTAGRIESGLFQGNLYLDGCGAGRGAGDAGGQPNNFRHPPDAVKCHGATDCHNGGCGKWLLKLGAGNFRKPARRLPAQGSLDTEDTEDTEGTEKSYILEALRRTGGNQTRAAEILHLSVRSLRHLLDKHGIRSMTAQLRSDAAGRGASEG